MNKNIPQKKEDGKSIVDQYYDLYNSIDKNNPKGGQLKALRTFIEESFDALNYIDVQINKALDNLLFSYSTDRLENTIIMTSLDGMKAKMKYSESSMIEKMLINNVMVSWLRLQIAETNFTNAMKNQASNIVIECLDKLVTSSQKRYLRATESLIRVRKSGVKLQINIATDGGKQKNLQV